MRGTFDLKNFRQNQNANSVTVNLHATFASPPHVTARTCFRSDDVIGQVKLGSSATEENEMKHWESVVEKYPPEPVTATHDIMEPDETMYLPHQPGTTYL